MSKIYILHISELLQVYVVCILHISKKAWFLWKDTFIFLTLCQPQQVYILFVNADLQFNSGLLGGLGDGSDTWTWPPQSVNNALNIKTINTLVLKSHFVNPVQR